jgi:hypothetical protein
MRLPVLVREDQGKMTLPMFTRAGWKNLFHRMRKPVQEPLQFIAGHGVQRLHANDPRAMFRGNVELYQATVSRQVQTSTFHPYSAVFNVPTGRGNRPTGPVNEVHQKAFDPLSFQPTENEQDTVRTRFGIHDRRTIE